MSNTHIKLGLIQRYRDTETQRHRHHAAHMQPEEKDRATAAFLRSFIEALIGDWEHLGERLHLETIRERERHTQAPTAARNTHHKTILQI